MTPAGRGLGGMRLRPLVARLLLVAGSVVLTLLLLELAVRAWSGAWTAANLTGIGATHDRLRGDFRASPYPWVADPGLGWAPRPGTTTVMAAWDDALVTVDDRGLRSNGADPVDSAGCPVTVLAVGDSFTFGDQVGDGDTWPAALERELGCRVLNGGVFGYGVDQTFLRARRLVAELEPDILVFSLMFADVFRCEFSVSQGIRKPFFTVDERGALRLIDCPVPDEGPRHPVSELVRRAAGNSLLAHHLMVRLAPGWWFSGRRNLRAADRGERPVPGHHIACLLMEELASLRAETGVEVIVLAQYTTFDDATQDAYLDPVLSCAVRSSVPVFSLRRPLRRLRREDPETYASLFDNHMTPRGNRQLATWLAEHLRRLGLVRS